MPKKVWKAKRNRGYEGANRSPKESTEVANTEKFLEESREIEENSAKVERLKIENSKLYDENKDLKSELDAVERHQHEMHNSFQRKKSELKAKIESRKLENVGKEEDIREHIKHLEEVNKLKEEYSRLLGKKVVLKLETEAKNLEAADMEGKLNAIGRNRKEMQEMFERDQSRLKDKIDDLENKLGGGMVEVVKQELSVEVEKLKNESFQFCAKTKDLELKLEATNLEVTDINRKLDEAQRLKTELHEKRRILQAEVDDLKERLAEEKSRKDGLKLDNLDQ